MNLERGNSPGIDLFLVEFDVIVVVRQALSESTKAEAPRPGLAQRFLEICSETRLHDPAVPSLAVGAALKPIPAQEVRVLRLHIAEARHVGSIWASAEFEAIFVAGNQCGCSSRGHVVHQI